MRVFEILILLIVVACSSSSRNFSSGEYEKADYSEKATHWEDRFNEWDSRELIKGSLESFTVCGLRKNHVYMISTFENQTSEELDMPQIKRELIDQMQVAGFSIIDKSSRADIHQEHEYNSAGYVNPSRAAVKGRQEGVEVLLRVVISSKTQVSPDKNFKTVRYRMSIQGVDMESALVRCAGSHEVKKRYEKERVAF